MRGGGTSKYEFGAATTKLQKGVIFGTLEETYIVRIVGFVGPPGDIFPDFVDFFWTLEDLHIL